MTPLDRDRQLLERHRAGDASATAELLRLYEPLLSKRVRPWLCGGRLAREDLMQEARIGLLDALKNWDPDRGALATHAWRYVLGVVNNHAMRMSGAVSLRQAKKLPPGTDVRPALSATNFDDMPERADQAPRPEDAAMASSRTAILAAAITEARERMTRTEKRMWDLVGGQGMLQRDVAKELGVTHQAVQQSYMHALGKIRSALERRGIHSSADA